MVQWILAWRYFFKRPISILAVAAVALCVFIVIVVMTVMSGLVEDFREKNHTFTGDCVIESDSLVGFGYYEDFLARLSNEPIVEAASPVARGMGIAVIPRVNDHYNIGVEIYGIDPDLHSRATNFAETLYYTEDISKAFIPVYNTSLPGCIPAVDVIPIGRRLPEGGYFHWNSPIVLEFIISAFPLNSKGVLARGGMDPINTKSFYYSDDSHSGLVKVDGAAVYLPLQQAQILCGMDTPFKRITSIHIKFKQGISVRKGVETIRALWTAYCAEYADKPGAELFGHVRVQSWQVNRRSIIAPMETEQVMMTMAFLMLGVITVFIIFVVLYMIISHKSKDIGILKSMGVSVQGILAVFLMFSVFVGLAGSIIGGAIGCLFLAKINGLEDWLYEHYQWQLWDRTIYAIGDIPNKIEPQVVTIIVISALVACLIGAAVPSFQAARKKPVESLQVNQL
ncbi:MAG: FtsX-like permease family protein [Phycisphaerae bacterium]|nr:FtsX-like permease family protein [Phycisphaerae bacterium]